jgi:hypothetical protein
MTIEEVLVVVSFLWVIRHELNHVPKGSIGKKNRNLY